MVCAACGLRGLPGSMEQVDGMLMCSWDVAVQEGRYPDERLALHQGRRRGDLLNMGPRMVDQPGMPAIPTYQAVWL